MVVFDLAGTTVVDRDDVTRCMRDTLQEKEGIALTLQQANRCLGRAKDLAIAEFLTEHGKPSQATDPHVLKLLEDFEQRMIRFYLEDPNVAELSNASAVMTRLRELGVRSTVDTGFSRRVTAAILHRMGWERAGLIESWTSSDQVTQGRPAPYMIYQLMERLGVTDVARVIKIGDTPADLMMGRNARCGLTIGVLNGAHSHAELHAVPHDLLIPDISHLPNLVTA